MENETRYINVVICDNFGKLSVDSLFYQTANAHRRIEELRLERAAHERKEKCASLVEWHVEVFELTDWITPFIFTSNRDHEASSGATASGSCLAESSERSSGPKIEN